ncbi:MAG TPA: hypothetical protein VJB82_00910 [Candidatus Peribacterales bacterium]|nr:hypothetical protein [Candidatus Peribacterales bacterium]
MQVISLLLGVTLLAIVVTWNLKLFGSSIEQSTTTLNPPAAEDSTANERRKPSPIAATPLLVPGIESRNARRQSDVKAILDALFQYSLENGMYPEGITNSFTEICKQGAASCSGLIDLTVLSDTYLAALPVDPRAEAKGNGTRYAVMQVGSRITVSALDAEGGVVIEGTR